MGIKKKIIFGFVLIGILLLMSGILSSIELAKLNSGTVETIKKNKESMILSKKLLDALQQRNTSLLRCLTDTLDVYDSIVKASDAEFDNVLLILKNREEDQKYILQIEAANNRYKDVIAKRDTKEMFNWFLEVYSSSYYRVTTAVKDFMIHRQDEFQRYTAILEENVYRALMVGIIALAAGIILLGAFYYMIHCFFLSPVLKIEKSLRDFLKANIPYSVKVETNDEIHTLSDEVNELCLRTKNDIEL